MILSALRNIPKREARATLVALIVGLVVMGLKFAAYFITGSAAIFSDAVESVVNVIASAFALYALAYAHRPADMEHPYGHGKIEFMSAGFEGGMILLASAVIVIESIRTLVSGATPQQIPVGLVLLVIVMVAYTVLGLYMVRVGKVTGSIAVEADGRHTLADALTSLFAFAALLIVRLTGWRYADPLAAMIVSVYVATMGLKLLRRSIGGLLDEQDAADTQLLRSILDAHVSGTDPAICSYHKLRHRHSGRYHWVDFHLMVPASWDIARGHDVASKIEYEIEKALGEGNATAHVEPCADPACPACSGVRGSNARP